MYLRRDLSEFEIYKTRDVDFWQQWEGLYTGIGALPMFDIDLRVILSDLQAFSPKILPGWPAGGWLLALATNYNHVQTACGTTCICFCSSSFVLNQLSLRFFASQHCGTSRLGTLRSPGGRIKISWMPFVNACRRRRKIHVFRVLDVFVKFIGSKVPQTAKT